MTPGRIGVLIRSWLHVRGKEEKNRESHGSFSRNLQVSAGTQAQLLAFSLVESQASPSPLVLQAFYWLIKYRILLFSSSQMWCAVHTESMMRTGIADTRFLCPFPVRLSSHRLLKALLPSQDSCGNEQWEALFIKTPTSIRFLKGVFSACVGELMSLRHISYPKSRWQMRKTDSEDLNITEKHQLNKLKRLNVRNHSWTRENTEAAWDRRKQRSFCLNCLS